MADVQSFHFIDYGNSDRDAKRRARSHVMKGKNVGKRLLRRAKLQTARDSKIRKDEESSSRDFRAHKGLLPNSALLGGNVLHPTRLLFHIPIGEVVIRECRYCWAD